MNTTNKEINKFFPPYTEIYLEPKESARFLENITNKKRNGKNLLYIGAFFSVSSFVFGFASGYFMGIKSNAK
jgi:hypothetical protein